MKRYALPFLVIGLLVVAGTLALAQTQEKGMMKGEMAPMMQQGGSQGGNPMGCGMRGMKGMMGGGMMPMMSGMGMCRMMGGGMMGHGGMMSMMQMMGPMTPEKMALMMEMRGEMMAARGEIMKKFAEKIKALEGGVGRPAE